MTAKQFLYSVRDEQKEIEEIGDRIYELEMSLLPGAMRYDVDRVQTSPEDTITDRMAKIADYMDELKRKQMELTEKRLTAQRVINQLVDSKERQVLDVYFLSVKRPRMTDVAAMLNYSPRQTYRFYVQALAILESSWKDGSECHWQS